MTNFDLNVPVMGMSQQDYMAQLLEKNEKQEIDIERGKLSVSILKQMNNRSRLLLDAAKFELKQKEFQLQNLLDKNMKVDVTENKEVAVA